MGNISSCAIVSASGKINLCLDITGAAPDGYHILDTVMHSIALCDTVTIRRTADPGIRVTCSDPDVPRDEGNIAYQAAIRFLSSMSLTVCGLDIHIEKSLPTQAGLAGGSADAAAVLLGLNYLFDAGLSRRPLCELGMEIGADVPFCLTGGCKLAQGIGERISGLPTLPECTIVIAKPPVGVSTRQAFHRYDAITANAGYGALTRPDTSAMLKAIKAGNLNKIGYYMSNVFEGLTEIELVPVLKDKMLEDGAAGAAMSGSGSAVAGLFGDEAAAHACAKRLRAVVPEVWVTKPHHTGVEIISIQ